jgi:hypothetical protein
MPTKNTHPKAIRRFIALAAIDRREELHGLDRADLYDAAASLLDGAEAEAARLAAFAIREAEKSQLTLIGILTR